MLWRKNFISCLLFKSVLIKAADGADEVFGKVFPLGAGGDAIVGVAFGGIVFITAGANVFHGTSPFVFYSVPVFQTLHLKFWEFQEPFFKKVLGGDGQSPYIIKLLTEISFKQTCKCLTVTSFVASHFASVCKTLPCRSLICSGRGLAYFIIQDHRFSFGIILGYLESKRIKNYENDTKSII